MGAEQSNSSGSSRSERDRGKYSKDEVNRMLEHQRILFDKRFKELMAQNHNSAYAQKTAREEARKEVERLIKEQELTSNLRPPPQSPPPPPPTSQPTFSHPLERNSSPYSYTGQELKSGLTSPSTSSGNLYPNLNYTSSPSELSSTRLEDQSNSKRSSGVLDSANANQITSSECSSPGDKVASKDLSILTGVTSDETASGCSPGVLTGRRSHETASGCSQAVLIGRRSHETASGCSPGVLTGRRSHETASGCSQAVLIGRRSHETSSGCVEGVLTSVSSLEIRERFCPSAPPAPRERSLSRIRSRPHSSGPQTSNEDELNCPTCKKCYTLPIFQCQRGHSSCTHCKNRFSACGICGLPITDMRNITLEAYVGERKIQCPNSDDGCSLSFKIADMENHLRECPFGQMQCPLTAIFGQCRWYGKVQQMAAHFDIVHQMHRQGNVDTEMRLLNTTHDNQVVYFVVIGTFNFLFHIKVSEQDGLMYVTTQLLGSQHSAAKWSYEIHIYNKAEPRRKYEFSDICNSINTPLKNIIADSKCAIIPLSYAKTFVNNDSMWYKFFIRKDVNIFRNNNFSQKKIEGRNNNFGNNHRGRGARRRN